MIIQYSIDENDYLTHQLFVASKSERTRKKRQRSKVLVPIIYGFLGLLFFFEDNFSLAIGFFTTGLLWYFIYPAWERRRYVNHYRAFIKENHKDKNGKTGTLELSNDFLLAKDNGSEAKIMTIELEEICEIPTTIFLRLMGGQSFILPKDKIFNMENVKNRLMELSTYLNIEYNIDENWKWK